MAKVHFEHGSIEFHLIPNHQNIDFFLSDYEKSILIFIKEWINGKTSWQLQTSGSTGKPKTILLHRNLMEYSAKQTVKTLNLAKNCNVGLFINADFVGGKMMIVRCLINEMNLLVRKPSTQSLTELPDDLPIHFAAFVPLQISTFLNDEHQLKQLNKLNNVIIGGAPLDDHSLATLRKTTVNCWQTYGMTETYSHVALKKISGSDLSDRFTATGDVLFSTDHESRLIINGTITDHQPLLTNDIVRLQDNRSFEWIGRYDHVINSGGVKISPELLESKIRQVIDLIDRSKRFFIGAIPDKKLGEKLVLYIEGAIDTDYLSAELKRILPKYEVPKEIILKPEFVYTQSGKINRIASQKG
ncbi:MAG: AMP-binding protein [Cyclobacteriaceae bacterium]